MGPLADAYAAAVYGDNRTDDAAVVQAALALKETEDRLSARYALRQRIAARYRLGSLIPAWVRALVRRR